MLSNRLLKIAEFVTPGNVLVDVGCDHAFLSIELVRTGVCPCAVATDIKKGPIHNAKVNIKAAGLEDKITAKISDGLAKIRMFEGDTLVIAGMGGNTIMHILTEGDIIAKSFKEIILEPQSEICTLRRFLYDNDFYLVDEDMVCESGKYYPILKVATKKGLMTMGTAGIKKLGKFNGIYDASDLSMYQYIFGPYLIKNKNKTLIEFLHKEMDRMEGIRREFFLIDSKINNDDFKKIEDYIANINQALEDCEEC